MVEVEITELLPAIRMGILPPLPSQVSILLMMGVEVRTVVPLHLMELVRFAQTIQSIEIRLDNVLRQFREIR